MEEKELHKKVKDQADKLVEEITEQEISSSNIEFLDKLINIKKNISKIEEEEEKMNYGYGNYRDYNGRGPGHGSYGEYERGYGEYGDGPYGRRGVDSRYRGDDYMNRMYGDYGRYMENRGRYGANSEETDKAFHFMNKSLKEYIDYLFEEAETPQQKQMLRETLQTSMR